MLQFVERGQLQEKPWSYTQTLIMNLYLSRAAVTGKHCVVVGETHDGHGNPSPNAAKLAEELARRNQQAAWWKS